jgi:NTE family protein
MQHRNIALVLSSGGARGLAHIGVIEELEKNGYIITSIAGTSMGAMVGGMYAAGQLADFKAWMCTLDKKAVFDLLDFTLSTSGVIKGERVIEAMKKMIADRDIESLPIPFCALATDIIHWKEVVFRQGSLYDAIKASSSIPTLVTPFCLNGILLVDGGVMNPVPINHVVRTKHDLMVVVNVNANLPGGNGKLADGVKEDEKPTPENGNEIFGKYLSYFNGIHKKNGTSVLKSKPEHLGYFDLMSKSLNLMIHQMSALTIELYKPDIVINISKDSFGIYDFHKTAEIIEEGARMAREVLEKEHAKSVKKKWPIKFKL